MGSSGALSGLKMKGRTEEVGAAHLRQRIARNIVQDDSLLHKANFVPYLVLVATPCNFSELDELEWREGWQIVKKEFENRAEVFTGRGCPSGILFQAHVAFKRRLLLHCHVSSDQHGNDHGQINAAHGSLQDGKPFGNDGLG